MIKATVICGGSAVREYDAYSMGLADAADWDETVLVNKEFVMDNDTSTDCKHCKKWRATFCDRENDVYCPDCGKLIIHREKAELNNNE